MLITNGLIVFIFVPLACVLFIWFYLPETNGLSLEEIGMLFGDEVAQTDELPPKFGTERDMSINGVEIGGSPSVTTPVQGEAKAEKV